MKRKVIVTIETEVDERLCRFEFNHNKTMFTNNTENRVYFVDDNEAITDISNEIEDHLNYNILKVEDSLCGNVIWIE